MHKLVISMTFILQQTHEKDLTDSGFSVNRRVSDKKKNNYGNRLISLHHSLLGLYIVSSCVGKCDRPNVPCFSTTDLQENST